MTAATKAPPAAATLALTIPAFDLIPAFKDALLFAANDMARPVLESEDFGLNPQFLARIGKLSRAQDPSPVRVRGQGKLKPVAFECPDTRVVIMPVRLA